MLTKGCCKGNNYEQNLSLDFPDEPFCPLKPRPRLRQHGSPRKFQAVNMTFSCAKTKTLNVITLIGWARQARSIGKCVLPFGGPKLRSGLVVLGQKSRSVPTRLFVVLTGLGAQRQSRERNCSTGMPRFLSSLSLLWSMSV